MNQNDKRINAYKKIAAFNPQKLTAEEVTRTNAAVKSNSAQSSAGKVENSGQKNRRGLPETALESAGSEKGTFVPGLGVLPSFSSQNQARQKSDAGETQRLQADFSQLGAKRSRQDGLPPESPLLQKQRTPLQKPSENRSLAVETDSLKRALERNGLLKLPTDIHDSSYRRVAKFLLLIGVDEAAQVLAHLPQKQIEKIIPEIASIRSVDPNEAAVIMAEFETLVHRVHDGGGVETARTILEKAFGTELAEQMMQKAVPESGAKPFDYLNDLDGERLFLLLRDETAPVRALVLSHLTPALAADAIKRMEPADKTATIQRLARMTALDPDVIRRADQGMREKMEHALSQHTDSIDGRGALAQILRRMDPLAEKEILANLTGVDSELESDLRKRLFTIEDIVHADDRYLQTVLRAMSDSDIALLLAGKPQPFREKLCANVSKGRAEIILEEEKMRSPVTRKESDTITNTFVSKLRAAWERGDFTIQDRDASEWVD